MTSQPAALPHLLQLRQWGIQPYLPVWQAMNQFTSQRQPDTADQLWLVQHHAVFTQGQTGKACHLLDAGDIPVIQSDRGGQITYHGPGQQILYILLDLRRLSLNVRQLVSLLEQTVIATLRDYHITAYPRADAPGVYVDGKKICSLGLRIRHGCSFHGLALNIAMDLSPFSRINPCGYPGLIMTQLTDYAPAATPQQLTPQLIHHFTSQLSQLIATPIRCQWLPACLP